MTRSTCATTAAQGVNTQRLPLPDEEPEVPGRARSPRLHHCAGPRRVRRRRASLGEGGGYSKPRSPGRSSTTSCRRSSRRGQWYQFDPEEASQLLQAAGYTATNKLGRRMRRSGTSVSSTRRSWCRCTSKIPEIDIQRSARSTTRRPCSMLNDRNFEATMNVTLGRPRTRWTSRSTRSTTRRAALNHNNLNDAEMDRLVRRSGGAEPRGAEGSLAARSGPHPRPGLARCSSRSGSTAAGSGTTTWSTTGRTASALRLLRQRTGPRVWLDEGAPEAAVWPEVIEGRI